MKYFNLILLYSITVMFTSYAQYKHPGLYSTLEQIEFVKKQIKDKKEPWKSAFEELVATNPTSRNPKPHVRVPGSSKPKERKDMDAMITDGSHAHSSALLFALTGEKKYADYAIKVLNAWNIFQKMPMPLYATWAAPHFVNAAELMKHLPNTGWKDADRRKFDNMLRNHFWKQVQRPPVNSGSNHACTANEAQFAIAIYLDDQAMFDQAMEDYEWLMPRWIFLADQGIRVKGETANTCRDLSHTRLTIGLIQASQYAYNQGIDLFKRDQNRWIAFAELHAGIMMGDKPAPKKLCAYKGDDRKGVVFCKGNVFGNDPSKNGLPPCQETAWEILINHINTRLNKKIPLAVKMTKRNRPFGKISTRADKWETLMHGNQNPEDLTIENDNNTGTTNQQPNITITSPKNGDTFIIGDSINITANASDTDGNLDKVNFKIDGEFYKTDNARPFENTFTPTSAGKYVIGVRAIDKAGLFREVSVTVTVNEVVVANRAPSINITSPNNNQVYNIGETINLKANASDPDNNLDKVNFKINGDFYKTDGNAPYENTYTPSETGNYVIGARAFDKDGLSKEVTVNIQVIDPTLSNSEFSKDNDLENISLYPSPSSSIINMEGLPIGTQKLTIVDVTGKNVMHTTISNEKSTINISNLSNGLYFIQVYSGGSQINLTFVKN